MKIAARIGLALLASLVILAGAGYVWMRQSLPQMSGTLAVPGLAAPVEVIRDANDVPHIYAKSIADAHFALGYVHAQDRLWQMEMNRRVASARLSEVFGAASLETDRFLRTLGVYRAAEAALAEIQCRDARGARRLCRRRERVPRHAFRTAAARVRRPRRRARAVEARRFRGLAQDDGLGPRRKLVDAKSCGCASRSGSTLGRSRNSCRPIPDDAPLPVRDLAQLYRGLAPAAATIVAAAPPSLPEGARLEQLGGRGLAQRLGKPMLANDPHLGLNAPAIWYFAHLSAPGLDAIGATLPGSPMLVLGRNDRDRMGLHQHRA